MENLNTFDQQAEGSPENEVVLLEYDHFALNDSVADADISDLNHTDIDIGAQK